MQLRIGLDLDNTLICYDRAFLDAARRHEFVSPDFTGDKRAIRDVIRAAAVDGDMRWQRLQGYVYGPGIQAADIFPGALAFITQARDAGHRLSISSHKTEFGHFDETRTPLRRAALDFLESNGVLALIHAEDVRFSAELTGKLKTIVQSACTHFVDDLEDVLDHPEFPRATRGLWFAPNRQTRALNPRRLGTEIIRSWYSAAAQIFEPGGVHV